MQQITKNTPTRTNARGLQEILIYSITQPGWTLTHRFREVGFPNPGRETCRYGCKIYENREHVRVVFHNSNYGCPL
jgi:hypothetical protein